MDLPFDFRKANGSPRRLCALAFDLPSPVAAETGGVATAASSPLDAQAAAAFAILLFRYGGQAPILLDAARLAADGRPLWRGVLRLEPSAQARSGAIARQAADWLAREAGDSAPAGAPIQADGGRAAVVFADARSADALERAARAWPDAASADLQLFVGAAGATVPACFFYDEGAFKRPSIERAARHLGRVLACLLEEPDAPVARLALMSPEERRFLDSVCVGQARRVPPPLAHEAFEARAAAAPAAVAVRFLQSSLTYGELEQKANALARRLAAAGAGPEARVAVCLEPSLEVPVALLATLKAGAVYVPLDPTHPEERLHALMSDIRPAVVLTRAPLRERMGPCAGETILLDDGAAPADPASEPGERRRARPEDTAYIYFTSGTTGTPKGAMASQANLAAYLASARERYGICDADVMPAIARFSFSISMFELLAPLTSGGTLVILEREHVLDLERLAKTLEGCTIFHAGPSLLKSLLAHIKRRYASFDAFARVRHASSGGDMVPPEVLESLKEAFPRAEVFVIYGCTEIACMGCTYPAPRDRVVARTYVGRPFDGVGVRVVDPSLNPVPLGIVGEICFAGEGVVKGYLDRPDLTAQKFVEIDGRRYYRTGDLGRFSDEGWLEILGRSDFQVKVRGMRVELAEIEHYLRRAAGVRDGVVMPMTIGGDEKALVAYIVMDRDRPLDPAEPSVEAIRSHMARHLPEYMLPAAYVELEKLPLNHNMKIDRRALPAPGQARRPSRGAPGRAPATPTEKALAALWSRLLGVGEVSLDDRFFDLGGHSLLGLQLIVEAERELGVAVTGLELVRESLEGLSALCDARLGRAPAAPKRPPAGASAPEPFFFGERAQLYGVLTGARLAAPAHAALLCPPLGQDHHRGRFVLQRLAARLEARGVPALLFDYCGCGDSLGDTLEAGPARWRRDIGAAYRELRRRFSDAAVSAVGVRLGAALLADAGEELELSGLTVWDPVCDGTAYLEEARALHDRFVGKWRRLFRPPPPRRGVTELLGLSCSDAAAVELSRLRFAPRGLGRRPRLGWLASTSLAEQKKAFDTLSGLARQAWWRAVDRDPGWEDVTRLGDIIPDLGYSQALAELVVEGA